VGLAPGFAALAGDYPSSAKFVSLLTAQNPTVTVRYGIYSNGGGIPTCIAFRDGVETQREVGGFADSSAAQNYLLNFFQTSLGVPENARTVAIKVDNSAPDTVAAAIPAGSTSGPVTVTLTATDALSGVAATVYRLHGAATWTPYTAPFTVSAPGTHVYEYRSRDNAGNIEAVQRFIARILPAPAIAQLSPISVKRGASVTLTGTNFGAVRGASTVKFGTAKSTAYLSWSATKVTCKVPARAKVGKLKVTVATAGGTSNALSLTVKQ